MKRGFLIAVLLAAIARPSRADCTKLRPVDIAFGQPGLGATNVPINTAVVFTWSGTTPAIADSHLTLFAPDGSVVDSTVTSLPSPGANTYVYQLVPKQPLEPLTMYKAGDTTAFQCEVEPCTVALTPQWQFVTGTATDTTAPPPAVVAVASQADDVCTDGSCCGPYHARVTYLKNPATGAVRYDLYDDGQLVQTDAPFAIATVCAQPGDMPYKSVSRTVALAPGLHHLTMRGYDNALNEAIGTEVLDLDLACPTPAGPDAGVPGPDAGGPAAEGDAGCGCRSSGGGDWWLLVLVGLIAARRRRATCR